MFQILICLTYQERFSTNVNEFRTNAKNKQTDRESGNDLQDNHAATDRTGLTYRSRSVYLSPKLVHHRIRHSLAMDCARFRVNKVPFKRAPSLPQLPLLPRPEPPRSLQRLPGADAHSARIVPPIPEPL